MPRVKIAGITNKKDARWAALLGVEYISVSMVKGDTKKVSLSRAREIKALLPSYTEFITEYNTESINKNEIKKIQPDYIQMQGTVTPGLKNYIKSFDVNFILEINLKYLEMPKLSPKDFFLVRFNNEISEESAIKVKEQLNMKKTIVEGDLELDLIKKYSKTLQPRAWGVKNIINKSPRRIDYSKMKNFNREISLI